ncbi:toll/interleukin-1 receptor domain-containing protein [Paenibacillus sp. 2TAB26]|uniref:toll/interleukin-1 receptor domain-containing protein n=1 Tax=Paenibacillus sp. 2TAB26 TaxID=3233005 RepID=UPI003F9982F7
MAIRGRNFALRNSQGQFESFSAHNFTGKNVCIFLSHISVDKAAVTQIGDYIQDAGFNIYLDINDENLQRAVAENDAARITAAIEKGVSNSSHMMCIVSEATKDSWWVPYEVGYGKKSNKELSTLALRNVTSLPDYLKITYKIEGVIGLNKYLNSIRKGSTSYEYLTESTNYYHSLNPYLKTDR